MKTAIRTPIVEAIRSVIQGGGGGPVSPVPLFYWKGQNTLAATTGTDPTFTRATAATFEDFEGVIRTVESSEPRFQGARRVENRVTVSEDFSNAAWVVTSGTKTAGQTDPNGGTTATRVTATSTNGRLRLGVGGSSATETYCNSIWVRRATGVGGVNLVFPNSDAAGGITLTSSWQRFSVSSVGTSNTNAYIGIQISTSGDEVDVAFAQQENVTGQTNQNPSEYVSTGVGTGPELITNGDFSNGTTDWTAINATLSVVAQRLRVTSLGASQAYAYQGFTTVIGKSYSVTLDMVAETTPNTLKVRIGTGLGSSVYGNYSVVSGNSYTWSFTATTTTGNIALYIETPTGAGETADWDNISVKAVGHGANVDGVEYFNTLNANTVTANVVTEAVGSPLTRANTQFGDLHGVAGDYFSTPNVVTTWGELDIRARAQVDSFPNNYAFLADKTSVFFLLLTASGSTQAIRLRTYLAAGGTKDYYSVEFPTSQFGVRNWYRATYDPLTGDVKFFTADGNLEAPAISDYTQLGTTQNSGANAIAVTTQDFTAGAYSPASTTYPFDGDIYRSQVFNEIDGTTPVVDFDFGDYVSGSTWNGIPYGPEQITNGDFSSATGWTLNGNSTIAGGVASNLGAGDYIAQGFSTTPNQSYVIFFDVLAGSNSGNSLLRIGTSANSTSILNTSLGALGSIPSRLTTTFTATGTTTWITFYQSSFTSSYSNVSVKENQVFTLEGNASIFQPPVDASGPFGYLAEKASTNLVLQSEDFTTSWIPFNATVAANAAVAPDGTTTMDRLVVTTANTSHDVFQSRTGVAGTNYTHSVYMKSDGARYAGVTLHANGSDFIAVVVDLFTGLVTDTEVGNTSGTIVATGCEDAGNGIYRVWVSGNVNGTMPYMISFISDVAVPATWSNGRPSYTGVLGEDILLWGAQAELGTYPTSYIPTTTTGVLRNADVLIAGDMVTDAAGSGYAEASSIWSYNPDSFLLARTPAGRILYGSNAIAIEIYDGTTLRGSTAGPPYTNIVTPVASTWGNNITPYKNGVVGTVGPYDGTIGVGNLGIGHNNSGSNQWNGTIREVKIFDSELTAAEVGDL